MSSTDDLLSNLARERNEASVATTREADDSAIMEPGSAQNLEDPALNSEFAVKKSSISLEDQSLKESSNGKQRESQDPEEGHVTVQDEPTELERGMQTASLSETSLTDPQRRNDESRTAPSRNHDHDSHTPSEEDAYPEVTAKIQSDERSLAHGTSTEPFPSRTSAIPINKVDSNSGHSSTDHTAVNKSTAEERDGVYTDENSESEIQSIMDQFGHDGSGPSEEEVMSPRTEFMNSDTHASTQYPPRTSSLEPTGPISPGSKETAGKTGSVSSYTADRPQLSPSQKTGAYSRSKSLRSPEPPPFMRKSGPDAQVPSSPQSTVSLPKTLPPVPDPEPDLPFDFHRFLEQLRHRTADPVAKFLRSFLVEFGKKQWMVHEQVKIISDFLAFITNKMAQCDVWRGVSEAEFDNAKEGMEKLVMNRLYTQTFSPAIPPPASVLESKGKKKDLEKVLGPTRRGQHQEDIERDDILGQKVRIYGWVQEEHLDIQLVGDSGRRFLLLAQQEILKIRTYRAPRDKVICVLNCCKVIFGLLRNSKSSDTSADSFVPLLIYVVLRANPEHLVSNVQYILRFRNQDKLGGEAGYYLSSLMGAIQFIENLDRTSLTITDDEFEKNVEAAVSIIAEKHKDSMVPAQPPRPTHISEKSGLSEPEIAPRNSTEVEYAPPRRPSAYLNPKDHHGIINNSEESSAVNGLLRTIQKPLSSIGRMFSDDQSTVHRPEDRGAQGYAAPPEPPRRLSPAVFQPPRESGEMRRSQDDSQPGSINEPKQSHRLSAEDAAARQASVEAAEAQRIQRNEHKDVVETLAGMFPDLDRDIIDDVVRVKQGRVGLAVDACLALST